MKNENTSPWGAKIERGEITAVHRDADDTFRYDIKSIDRPGVTSKISCSRDMLSPGAKVYFFLFDDGHGMILGRIGSENGGYSYRNKIAPYLYEVWYDGIDYQYAYEYFKAEEDTLPGHCSAIRNGNLYGRNFDWKFDESAEFIVHVPRIGKRYASVGIAGCVAGLTEAFVRSGKESELYRILPFRMMDGINECGLVCNINVVPADYGKQNAIPAAAQDVELSASMIVRYVLDHFSSAREAVQFLQNHAKIYFSKAIHDMDYEAHWMIADPNETYIVEIVNNAVAAINHPYMTNFHLYGVQLNADGGVYAPETQDAGHNAMQTNGITGHGSGLERFNLIAEAYSDTATYEGMRDMLDQLRYTRAYPGATGAANPVWYTEFVGGDITCASPVSDYAGIMELAGQAYSRRNRETALTWQTVHSVIYDISGRSARIKIQESAEEFQFSVD